MTQHPPASEADEHGRSETFYRTVLESINDMIFVHGFSPECEAATFTQVNDPACKRLGYTRDELLALSPFDIIPQEDLAEVSGEVEALRKKGRLLFEKTFLTKSGERVPVEINTRIVEVEGGGQPTAVSIARDITERKKTEEKLRLSKEKYRSLVEFTDDHIYLVDRNGRYLFMNSKYLARFDGSLDEVINRPYGEFHSRQATKKFQKNLKQIFETGRSQQFEHQSERDGRYFLRTLSPVKEEDGDVSAVTVVSKDITEKKELEAQLLQAQKMEALGTMVAGVAHEINNPNSLIMLNVPILQDIWRDIQPLMEQHALKEPRKKYGGLSYSYLDKKLETLLSDMREAATRISNVIKNFKDFARPSDIADKQPMKVNDSVENAIRLAQTTLRKSGIDLELALPEDLPLIQGNRTGIEQIVMNLLMNAIQAIDHDQGKIKLTTGVTKKDARVFISVADNGRGIDPLIADKIFEPFVTTKQAEGGTGLGLSVTYSLVKAHDGKITFESKAGKGTVFSASFPSELSKIQAKILVVDDDASIRKMLAKALTMDRAYAVDEASDGIEALIKLGTYRPDLLILDIFMPEMDGIAVCRALRENPEFSDMKVVIITGFPDDQRLKQVEKMGFTNIFTKPMNLKDFIKDVDNILKNKIGSRQ